MHTWRNENQTEGFISCLRDKGSLMASMPTAVVTNILDLVIPSLLPPPPPLINGIKHPSMVLNTILMQLVLNLQLKKSWITNWQSKTRDLIIYTILCRSFKVWVERDSACVKDLETTMICYLGFSASSFSCFFLSSSSLSFRLVSLYFWISSKSRLDSCCSNWSSYITDLIVSLNPSLYSLSDVHTARIMSRTISFSVWSQSKGNFSHHLDTCKIGKSNFANATLE